MVRTKEEDAVYRQVNKDAIRTQKAAHYLANRETIRAQQAADYLAKRETIRAQQAAHYLANKEEILARRNPAHAAEQTQRRRTIKLHACPPWARNDLRVLALHEIADWLRLQGDDVAIDHIFPLKPRKTDDPRGLDVYANLRIVDRSTNASKSNRQPTEQEVAERRSWL
jgi:hypothetical protein